MRYCQVRVHNGEPCGCKTQAAWGVAQFPEKVRDRLGGGLDPKRSVWACGRHSPMSRWNRKPYIRAT